MMEPDNKTDTSVKTKHANIKVRFIVFFVLLISAAFAVALKYAVLMLGPAPLNAHTGTIMADRGQILDRNGRILAIQTRLGNISVWRPGIKNLENLARQLSPLLQIPESEIIERIELAHSDFIYLKKQVDRLTLNEIEKLLKTGIIEGVSIEPVMGRIYPEEKLAGQIIGFTGSENTGLAGIEYAYNDELSAKPSPDDPEGIPGNQIVLTIDTNIQYILEEIAENSRVQNAAEAVMLIVVDPRSGDILGAASTPGFDPNNLKNVEKKQIQNKIAEWSYEPGSVFKVFSIASLLDKNAISPDTTFFCNGRYEKVTASGERIVITCLGAHGNVNARDIIIYSCNAGAAYAADRLNNTAFYESVCALGFGERTNIGFTGENAGFLRPISMWSARSKPTLAMGHEISVSVLQMVQAATAVANDGLLVKPRIVLRITDSDGRTLKEMPRSEPKRVFKTETAKEMRQYMQAVTSNIGTGWRANVEDMPLAVKTGTAQMINSATRRYSETDFIASCIALLPASSPTLIIYGVIIKPKGESTLGGRIAAPLIREAADQLIDYLGIPRGRNPQINHTGHVSLPGWEIPIVGDYVPDFTGYSKRQLLPLLLRDDLNINITGDGWVKSQSPPAGTPITSTTVIALNLE
ncbi:MAG: transpeptidase family protein [Spirochaetaceae bacterium]|jgi:cell division protein FtsI (penicillin-binding protein 3)|nr:transpeptidase family protein [Spirochaetaceae bacterium]